MPIMEVVLEQSHLNQQVLNRFNYLASGTPSAVTFSFALANVLGAIPTEDVYPTDRLMGLLRAFQDANVSFVNLLCRHIYSLTDFYQTPFVPALVGGLASTTQGPVPSYGFISNKTRYDIRRGQKRFVGVTTNAMSGDNTFTSTVITAQNNLAEEMGATLEYEDGANLLTFAPIIVKREKYTVPGSDPARFAYRYFETEAEQLENIMTGITWQPYPNVRSQTSRQIGRGR